MKIIKEIFQYYKEAKTSEKIGFLFGLLEYLLAIFMSVYIPLYETELYLRVLGLILACIVFTSVGMIVGVIIMSYCELDE